MTKEKMMGLQMITKSLVKNVVYLLRLAKFSDSDGTFNSDNEYLQS